LITVGVRFHQGGEIDGFLFSSEQLTEFWPTLDDFEGNAYERVRTKVTLRNNDVVEAYVYALRLAK